MMLAGQTRTFFDIDNNHTVPHWSCIDWQVRVGVACQKISGDGYGYVMTCTQVALNKYILPMLYCSGHHE